MGVVLRGPAVDEKADGNAYATGDHHGYAKLRPSDIIIFSFESTIDLIHESSSCLGADEEA